MCDWLRYHSIRANVWLVRRMFLGFCQINNFEISYHYFVEIQSIILIVVWHEWSTYRYDVCHVRHKQNLFLSVLSRLTLNFEELDFTVKTFDTHFKISINHQPPWSSSYELLEPIGTSKFSAKNWVVQQCGILATCKIKPDTKSLH